MNKPQNGGICVCLLIASTLFLFCTEIRGFSIGDEAAVTTKATNGLKVRVAPGQQSTEVEAGRKEFPGSQGTIKGGPKPDPQNPNGPRWWYIEWDGGLKGWSREDFLLPKASVLKQTPENRDPPPSQPHSNSIATQDPASVSNKLTPESAIGTTSEVQNGYSSVSQVPNASRRTQPQSSSETWLRIALCILLFSGAILLLRAALRNRLRAKSSKSKGLPDQPRFRSSSSVSPSYSREGQTDGSRTSFDQRKLVEEPTSPTAGKLGSTEKGTRTNEESARISPSVITISPEESKETNEIKTDDSTLRPAPIKEHKTHVEPVVGSLSVEQTIGECFRQFCNEGSQFLPHDFATRLQPLLPEVEVVPVFCPTGAQELYFAASRETSARCYWRIIAKREYLVPCPADRVKFEGIQGFVTPRNRLCSPEALGVCEPALLRRNGLRWEIEKVGRLE